MIRKIIHIAVIVSLAWFTTTPSISAGDAGGESLFSIGTGARALGLGGGFSSIADDATTIYYNPAGLSRLSYQEFSVMYMSLPEGTNYGFASYAYPISKNSGLGLGVMAIESGDIIRRNNFVESGRFSYSTFQLIAGYGRRFSPDISFGVSLKFLSESLDNLNDYGMGMDVGLTAEISKNVRVGLLARDIMPVEIRLQLNKTISPTSYIAGISFRDLALSDRIKMLTSIEIDKTDDRSTKLHTGAEFLIDNKYALRGGYDKDDLVFGGGVTIDDLKIDYAYKFQDRLSNSHRFSVSFLLGNSQTQKISDKQKRDEDYHKTIITEDRQVQFLFLKEKGDDFYNQNQLDSALIYYQRALVFDETNIGIVGAIVAIEESKRYQAQRHDQEIAGGLGGQASQDKYLRQASLFMENKQFRAASDMINLVLETNPESQEAIKLQENIDYKKNSEVAYYATIAKRAERERRYLDAVTAYLRILEIEPSNNNAHKAKERIGARIDVAQQLNKAIELYHLDKLKEARLKFVTIQSVDPENLAVKDYLEMIDLSEGAITPLETIQSRSDIWKYYIEGLRLMRQKEYQKAINEWKLVLKVFPNSLETKNNIKQAELRLKSEKQKK